LEKKRLTEAEVQERDDRLRAAGIKVVTDPPGTATVTLLAKRPTEMPTEGESRS
jgi:hypothetical protein